MTVTVDYKTFGEYVPTITNVSDLFGCLPVYFYGRTSTEVIVYKKTNKAGFFISHVSSYAEPPVDFVEGNINKYLDTFDLSPEIPDEGRCYLVNRITGIVIYDLDLGNIVDWDQFTLVPKENLCSYLIVFDSISDKGELYSAPAFIYESNGIPVTLFLRYQTKRLTKGVVTLYAEDLLLEVFESVHGIWAPNGGMRSWSIHPMAEGPFFSECQLATFNKVMTKISTDVADEGEGIVNGRYFSLKWIKEHRRLPDIDMGVLRDITLTDPCLEQYIDGLRIDKGKLEVMVADYSMVTFDRLVAELGISVNLFILVSNLNCKTTKEMIV